MLQKIILSVAVFLIILVALSFGEAIAEHAFAWISYLSGLLIHNFADLYILLRDWASVHFIKILIALALTLPISLWIIKSQGNKLDQPVSQRKIAIILAVFLGWLGAHRFYLGQIGWGIFYLVLFYILPPVAIGLGLIDAIRYAFMSPEEFKQRSP